MVAGGSSIKLVIPGSQQPPMDPVEILQSDGRSAASEGPSEEPEQLPSVGDSYEDVRLEAIIEPSARDEEGTETPFEIDIVHIRGVSKEGSLIGLSLLSSSLPEDAWKREFGFDVHLTSMLNGDPEFTNQYIEARARQLLSGLQHFRQLGHQASQKTLILTAYDIGAVVLKKAISIASTDHKGFFEIFAAIARIVFVGCFQRGNEHQMGLYVWKFLHAEPEAEWLSSVNLSSVQNLVSAIRATNTGFFESKISLRSRIFSLYAGETGKRIHSVFDYFTATMGLSTELALQEDGEATYVDGAFSHLAESIGALIATWNLRNSLKMDVEWPLMQLAAPDVQMLSESPSPDYPVLSSPSHQSWLRLVGTQILFLDGPDARSTTEAAEQIGLDWIRNKQSSGQYYARFFQFRWVSSDPRRNSMASMLTSCILHFFGDMEGNLRTQYELLQDQYKLHNTWTDDDLLRLVLCAFSWMAENTALVLLGLDECEPRSRRNFWAMLQGVASKFEEPVKIVVTVSKPGTPAAMMLRDELKGLAAINVLDCPVGPEETSNDQAGNEQGQHDSLLARLCPNHIAEVRVRKTIDRLGSMDHSTLRSVLRVAEIYSRWPEEKTHGNLTVFLDTIEDITPSSMPRTVVLHILRSLPNQDWLQRVFMWILYGERPLTLKELSILVSLDTNFRGTERMQLPTDEQIQQCLEKIQQQARGFIYLDINQVYIAPEVLESLDDGTEPLWTRIREQGSKRTAQVILEYLKLPDVQERLHNLYQQYESTVHTPEDTITLPIGTDGQDIVYYAVHALPYHLSSTEVPDAIEKEMRDPSGPYTPWAKLYWAMSNHFSRAPKGPAKTAWSAWQSSPESGPPSLVRLSTSNDEDSPESAMESLARAVRAGNQDLALIFAEQVVHEFQDQQGTAGQERVKFWPSILWRAVWLDMDRLLDFMLEHGKQQDDRSSAFNPSMLYLASRMGHLNTFRVLISHNADYTTKRDNKYSSLFVATARGHVEIMTSLLKKDPTVLDQPQPDTLLYVASVWGVWEAVELLLRLGADPNLPREGADSKNKLSWCPITSACSSGFTKTARVLLEHDADPNAVVESEQFPCLWLAAMDCRSVEMMKLLLDHGADPNCEALETPLMSQIVESVLIPEETKVDMYELLVERASSVILDMGNVDGVTPLMVASKNGNQSAAQWLLDKGASINALDSGNYNALFHAILGEKWNMALQLLAHGEKPQLNLVGSNGPTMLQSTLDSIEVLKAMLEAGADPSFTNNNGQTLLNWAVVMQRVEVVQLLLEPDRHMDIHHRDGISWSPIMDATGFVPNAEIARLLLEGGASLTDASPTGYTPLHLAVMQSRPEILQVLLDFHEPEDLDRRNTSGAPPLLALHSFSEQKSLDCIRLLVSAGADVNAEETYKQTLLIQASRYGSSARNIQNWLLSRPNIDIHRVSTDWGTALQVACEYGDVDLVTKLLQKGADANTKTLCIKSTPLIAACIPVRPGDLDDAKTKLEDAERVVRTLVANGADVTATSGITIFNALCAASFCAGIGTINFLLDKSASVQTPDGLGRLPIHFAAANGIRNFEAVALAHGEDTMIPDNCNKNALHWAAQAGNAATVRAILQKLPPKDRKTYVNLADRDGWTPLAWASRQTGPDQELWKLRSEPQDYEATIQCLIDYGADLSVRFRMGQSVDAEDLTPLKLAKRCEADEAIVELLTPEHLKHEKIPDEPVYHLTGGFCDFCFCQYRGFAYSCQTCSNDRYVICAKCYPTALVEHKRAATFEGPHTFDIMEEGMKEFVERPPSPVTSDNAAALDDTAPESGARASEVPANGDTPEFEEIDFHEDGIEQLDFPDLGNLDEL